MTEDSRKAIAVALTVECPDAWCAAKPGKDCVEGGASLTRIVVGLVRRLHPSVDAAGWPLRDSPEVTR